MGFSTEEIRLARVQFRSSLANLVRGRRQGGAALTERAIRELEERFLNGEETAAQGLSPPERMEPLADNDEPEEGTNFDLLFGMLFHFHIHPCSL